MRIPHLGFVAVAFATLLPGCMHPSMYYGSPYSQPMYAPPGTMVQPGPLYVPPSSAPPYNPLNNPSTYDEPTDTWQGPGTSTDSRFFGEDGNDAPVPNPKDAGGSSGAPFDSDF